jgi:phosphoglycolate phosphatase-like HAD superfamily hydrolase
LSSVSNAVVPDLLALDFDGVLCDGRAEYLESSWQVYCEIWDASDVKLDTIAPRFYELRSVIETGWEMPLLLRSLLEGISDAEILENWSSLVQQMLDKSGLTQQEMTRLLDEKRDRWIETNEQDWLAHHEFYPGVIQRLQAIFNQPSPQVYIITTKEGRFARKLLQKHGIQFPADYIIGKEYQQPKTETLTELLKQNGDASLWFVEDRLKTLLSVAKQPYLQSVRLFLAEWGYNTARSRQEAKDDPTIRLLSLDQFNQDFSHW